MRLTVVAIALDDEDLLPGLLASVRGLADEVVVVDGGSRDRTGEVAQAAGARFVSRPFAGIAAQEAYARAQGDGELLLLLRADERVSEELAGELRGEKAGPRGAAFRVTLRRAAFGGFVGDEVREVRAWHRGSSGPTVELSGGLLAEGPPDLAAGLARTSRRAESVAARDWREGARPLPGAGFFAFLSSFVLSFGFLDGLAGWRHARVLGRAAAERARVLRRLDAERGGKKPRGPIAETLRNLGRAVGTGLAAALLGEPEGKLPGITAIRKVLVIRPDERLGDQLLTTPLLRALRVGLPNAELHLLCAARQAPAMAGTSAHRVIPFEKRLAFRRPWRLLALLSTLRRERYDVAIEAAHWSGFSLTAALLARLSGAAATVGHARGPAARFLSHPVEHDPANANEVAAKLELLRPFGLLPRGLELECALGQDVHPARALLAAAGVTGDFAVLNPGARMGDRRWAPSAYAAVARGLVSRGLSVVVVWGPGEDAIARSIASEAGERVGLAPPTDLPLLAALLRLCRLCVSNNSGPMHLAVAVGAPTVGVFLQGDAARWGHHLPRFAAAEPSGDGDAAAVLAACGRLLATASAPAAAPASRAGT